MRVPDVPHEVPDVQPDPVDERLLDTHAVLEGTAQADGEPLQYPQWFMGLPAIRRAAASLPDADNRQVVHAAVRTAIPLLSPDDRMFAENVFGLNPETAGLNFAQRRNYIVARAGTRHVGARQGARTRLQFHMVVRRLARILLEEGQQDAAHGDEDADPVHEIEVALRKLVRKGLPVTPTTVKSGLLLLCSDENLGGLNAAAAEVNDLVRWALDNFENEVLAQAARILFGHAHGTRGRTLTDRRERAAATLKGYGNTMAPDSFRKGAEQRIIKELAWQLYRERLRRG